MASTNIQSFPGKVGVSNTNPIHTLDIGSNVYIDDTSDTKIRVYGNIHASGVTVDGSITVIETDNLSVKDPVLLLASGSTGTSDTGIIMKRADGDANVAIFYDEGVGLNVCHTLSGGDEIHLSVDGSNALATSIYGPVHVVNTGTEALVVDGGSKIDGNLQVGTVGDLFVDTVTSNVGVGTNSPAYKLDVHGTSNVGALTATSITASTVSAVTVNSNVVSDNVVATSGFYGAIEGSNVITASTGTFSSNLEVGTANLFVDTVTSNVGIGTTSPTQKLQVKGNILSAPVSESSTQTFGIYNGDNGTFDFYDTILTKSLVRTGDTTFTMKSDGFNKGFSAIQNQWRNIVFYTYKDSGSGDVAVTDLSQYERMRITSAGNVGIGTTSPAYKLDVVGGPTKSDGFILGTTNNEYTPGCIYTDPNWGMLFRGAVSSPGIADFVFNDYVGTNMMVIKSGNVGIGTTSPFSKLSLKPTTIYNGETGSSFTSAMGGLELIAANTNNARWNMVLHENNDLYFLYTTSGTSGWGIGGYLSDAVNVNQIDFTGQHRNFIDGVPYSEYQNLEGLIVSANKNKYYDINEDLTTGANAIQISQSLPLVSLSTKEKDKACFGVISGSEDPDRREYSQGSFVSVVQKQRGDRRAFINSVGEGAMWVVNTAGSLESGDYITTSNVAGYGQKQDSEFLANYTVAKITMDCDFEPATQPVQRVVKELSNVNYWVKTTYSNVTQEEYSNLADENRMTTTETVYVNENGETFTEQDEQSTYTELTRTVYQRITMEESKTEQEGYEVEVRQELVNVLDEHGQLQWEDTDQTEKAYKIRYLTANGTQTDEANAVHIAAFVGCTYHCG
jgi:hypothetical protein